MKVTHELSVCTSCLLAIASGVVETEDDRAAAGRRAELWGDQERLMVTGNDEEWFSRSECDGCGDPDAGTRHHANILGS